MASHSPPSSGANSAETINLQPPFAPTSTSESAFGSGSGSGPSAFAAPPPSSSDPAPSTKTKRIACLLCRKRKLRCDGGRPSCAACLRQNHTCVFDEVRKKTGPKKGYVRTLEARLAKLEKDTMYRNYTQVSENNRVSQEDMGSSLQSPVGNDLLNQFTPPPDRSSHGEPTPSFDQDRALVSQGIEEPLPSREVIDKLNNAFFRQVYQTLPMINRARYLAGFSNPANMRSLLGLRYIIWALGAEVSLDFKDLRDTFYQRARKYLERDDLNSNLFSFLTVSHCQAWVLVALYEFRHLHYPRAWLSVGRACRLSVMLGLCRLDAKPVPMQCSMPPGDWIDLEEKRRTFWCAYCLDRQGSANACWPANLQEEDIFTNLPCPEWAFASNKPCDSISLRIALKSGGLQNLDSFAASIVALTVLGRSVPHIYRYNLTDQDLEEDFKIRSAYWTRHHELDNMVSRLLMELPPHMRLPGGLDDLKVVFTNMCLHTAHILVHQYGLYVAKESTLSDSRFSEEDSKERCYTASLAITRILRMMTSVDFAVIPPFATYSIFSAARAMVFHLSDNISDAQARSALEFLVSALRALTLNSPLAENFLVYLDAIMKDNNVLFLLPLVSEEAITRRNWRCPKKFADTKIPSVVTRSLSNLSVKENNSAADARLDSLSKMRESARLDHNYQTHRTERAGNVETYDPSSASTSNHIPTVPAGQATQSNLSGFGAQDQCFDTTPSLGDTGTVSSAGATPEGLLCNTDLNISNTASARPSFTMDGLRASRDINNNIHTSTSALTNGLFNPSTAVDQNAGLGSAPAGTPNNIGWSASNATPHFYSLPKSTAMSMSMMEESFLNPCDTSGGGATGADSTVRAMARNDAGAARNTIPVTQPIDVDFLHHVSRPADMMTDFTSTPGIDPLSDPNKLLNELFNFQTTSPVSAAMNMQNAPNLGPLVVGGDGTSSGPMASADRGTEHLHRQHHPLQQHQEHRAHPPTGGSGGSGGMSCAASAPMGKHFHSPPGLVNSAGSSTVSGLMFDSADLTTAGGPGLTSMAGGEGLEPHSNLLNEASLRSRIDLYESGWMG